MVPVNVATVQELTGAIAGAHAGDEIVLAAGQYSLGDVDCAASGTPSQPIVVRAAVPLTAQLHMTGLEGFRVSGAHWIFSGLDISGGCGSDPDCEHAFHVFGAADGFTLRESRIVDFNAQLKVNAFRVNGTWITPNDGLVEGNEVFDSRARSTTTPVTKLDIDTGDRWVVRANYVHDFQKTDGTPTYGAFMKSGGHDGVFERNLVICSHDWVAPQGSVAVGMSFGGGGTAPQYCAPAFDPNVPCSVEHTNGVLRNNVIALCTDVGIYVNAGANTRVWFNTIIDTTGIDFRFAATTGEARGNVLSSVARARDGATFTNADNLANVTPNQFLLMYRAPLDGDLRAASSGSVDALLGKGPTIAQVADDYCARARPHAPYDLGALQASLGDCTTVPPPLGHGEAGADAGDDAAFPTRDSGSAGDAGEPSDSGEIPGAGARNSGCGCVAAGLADTPVSPVAYLIACACAAIRYVSSRSRRYPGNDASRCSTATQRVMWRLFRREPSHRFRGWLVGRHFDRGREQRRRRDHGNASVCR